MEALKKAYSPIYETDTDMCKMVFKRFDEIAEQLKNGTDVSKEDIDLDERD